MACHIDWHLDGLPPLLISAAFRLELRGGTWVRVQNVQQQKSEQNSICTSAFECIQAVFTEKCEVRAVFIINDLSLPVGAFKADGDQLKKSQSFFCIIFSLFLVTNSILLKIRDF